MSENKLFTSAEMSPYNVLLEEKASNREVISSVIVIDQHKKDIVL